MSKSFLLLFFKKEALSSLEVSVFIETTLVALTLEAIFGYPRAIGHPVMWIGRLIDRLDRRLNNRTRVSGVFALAIIVLVTVLPCLILQQILPWPIVAVLAATLPAQRSLFRHVADVAAQLDIGLTEGRRSVSLIVGRDPQSLDAAGVARAAIESLAENFSDGVVAPAFWCVVFGLPGIAVYKAINTADSMIGHRTPRHEAFGWAAARLDDLVNLPASRLSAVWIWLAATLHKSGSAIGAWRAIRRDASQHRSPNAGWPEAAMAGALGLRLAGPRVYKGILVQDAWMGDGSAEARSPDIYQALTLYRIACGLQIGALTAAVIVQILVC